ncbi:MAG: dihydrolipoyl dehydrogenase [Xanthomonadales bacterium]|nr:dihydrolipoyl dehydrogenase [Xanthomonadales bacterium]
MSSYDVIVIGAGPAGYPAAIRASQLGLKTAIVDNFRGKNGKPALGGTCLNVGCIPSKALLDSSKHFEHARDHYGSHGISTGDVSIDVPTMIQRKDKIVGQLTGGVAQLLKANKVDAYAGTGRLLKDRQVEVTPMDEGEVQVLSARNVILASGSIPIEIPNVSFDGKHIIDNAGALDLEEVPETLGVIGAGVIGLELGSVWRRLGSDVVLLEALPDFLALADADIARAAHREFKRQKLDIRLGTLVKSAEVKDGKVEVTYEQDGEQSQLTFDRLLVAVGRCANTAGLLADDCGVSVNQRGQIEVDEHCQTSVAGVWGIGDAVRGPMLAHKGTEEGVAVAERIAGRPSHVNLELVPWVIYSEPEVAWVGKTEAEVKSEGVDYRTGSFPFAATGRALAMGEPAGMVKVIADAETDRLLGVHICGANASEMIAEAVVAMEFHGSAEDLATICHAHPTMSEAVHEAALSVDKRAIHRVN